MNALYVSDCEIFLKKLLTRQERLLYKSQRVVTTNGEE